MMRHATTRHDSTRHDMTRHDTTRHGMIREVRSYTKTSQLGDQPAPSSHPAGWFPNRNQPAGSPAGCLDNQLARPSRPASHSQKKGTSRLVPHLGVWMTSRPDPATQPAGSQKRNQPAGSPLDVWIITSRPDPAAQPPSRLVPKQEPAGWFAGWVSG